MQTFGSDSKSACNAGDLGLIPALRRSPGEVNGYLLQYSCLENSMDRGAWGYSLLGVSLWGYSPWGHRELDMTERLTLFTPYRSLGVIA